MYVIRTLLTSVDLYENVCQLNRRRVRSLASGVVAQSCMKFLCRFTSPNPLDHDSRPLAEAAARTLDENYRRIYRPMCLAVDEARSCTCVSSAIMYASWTGRPLSDGLIRPYGNHTSTASRASSARYFLVHRGLYSNILMLVSIGRRRNGIVALTSTICGTNTILRCKMSVYPSIFCSEFCGVGPHCNACPRFIIASIYGHKRIYCI